MQHLHSLQIVHGDVTLANCMIALNGDLKLGDLGSAHSAHGFLLPPRAEITTAYARSPERWLLVDESTPAVDVRRAGKFGPNWPWAEMD